MAEPVNEFKKKKATDQEIENRSRFCSRYSVLFCNHMHVYVNYLVEGISSDQTLATWRGTFIHVYYFFFFSFTLSGPICEQVACFRNKKGKQNTVDDEKMFKVNGQTSMCLISLYQI